jgi:hypothetical protein
LPDRFVRQDIHRSAMLDDPASFHHVARIADDRRAADILLHEQQRYTGVPHARKRFENIGHDHRCEAFGRLVDQQQLWGAKIGSAALAFDANVKLSAAIAVVP